MNDFKQTLSSITRNLTKASGELIKTTKINLSISGEEERLKTVYRDIGKKVHEIYTYGGSLGKFFDEKYQEICEIENKLTELRGQLNVAMGTRPCPKCMKPVEKAAEFCSKCGAKMDPYDYYPAPAETKTGEYAESRLDESKTENDYAAEVVYEEIPASVRCKSCGSENGRGDKYCLSCGRMM